MADAATIYREAFLRGLLPPPAMTVSEWADEHRFLSKKGSAEAGPWRTSRTPYLKEPMDCLSRNHPARRVVMLFGSQLGKTEAGLNWLGACVHLWPAPMLIVTPTLDMAKRMNRQRLDPMLRETPALAELIPPARSRDSGNTMFLKEYPGGLFVLAGANSGSGLQSMPVAYLFADEVSSFPLEADDKGDPLENAEARTSNFPMSKVLLTSTPGTRGSCRITWEYEQRSDRRQYHAFMPCCKSLVVLRWREHMVWDKPDGEVWCQCPACGERVGQHHKTTMLHRGEWRPSAKGDGKTAGFHLPGWYAPAGWLGWEEIRDEFLRANGDPLLLKGWVNKRAAEAWEDAALAKVSAEGLMARINDSAHEHGHCPGGVLVLMMAVDVQDTWLEVTVWGYGKEEEKWRIWHQKIEGDPAQDDVWQQVTSIREIEWPHEVCGTMKVRFCAVDTGGHYTGEAYEYCRRHSKDGVVAIKGSSQRNSPTVNKGSKVDVNYKGKITKNGVMLYSLNVSSLKRTLYSRLKIEQPGPGYVHFDNATTEEYLQGLTCERLQPKYVKGFQVLEWVKPSGARNEPLDLAVYCLAMLELLKRRYNRATMWSQLAAQVKAARPVSATPEQPKQQQISPVLARRQATPTKRGGFVSGW